MDRFLEQLAGRLQIYDADIVSADEVEDWPQGKLNELVTAGILTEIPPTKGVVCKQCEENCYIEPEIRTPANGKAMGVFICARGRIKVDLNRLRQWQINKGKLEALGLLKKNIKRRKRRVSSELTKEESEAYRLVYIAGKTPKQAAIEKGCSPQNISKLLKKAEVKVRAKQSRSVNLEKAQALPRDRRGQESLSDNDT